MFIIFLLDQDFWYTSLQRYYNSNKNIYYPNSVNPCTLYQIENVLTLNLQGI